jgi:hypothetical protein
MRKIWTFLIVWVALFAVSFGIRSAVSASGSATIEARDDGQELQTLFDKLPSKTPLLLANVQTREFGQRTLSFMFDHDAGIRRCRELLMRRAVEPRTLFEVSFVPHVVGTHVVLDLPVLEKASIMVTAEEERCIQEEFLNLRLPLLAFPIPHQRMSISFCFSNLQPKG